MKPLNSWLLVPIALALAVLAVVLVLVPTSSRAASSAPLHQDTPAVIVYWHHNEGDRGEFMQELIDEFNANNPHSITVVGEYAGNYGQIKNKVIDGLQNDGPLPNVVVAYPNSFADFARFGAVRFLDAYFDDPEIGITDTADFSPGVLDYYRLGEYGGQLAGLQHGRSIEVMYYNTDLLTTAGVTVPTTWDEFRAACYAVKTDTVWGSIAGVDASRFATWLWSRGGELLSEDLNHAVFDQQPGLDSLHLFQTLIDDGCARLPTSGYEQIGVFGNGEVGLTFGSSVGIPYYRDSMQNGAQDAWGVARAPAVAGNEVVNSYGAGQGILHHSEAEDRAAWIFIKWLADADQTARWAVESGYFPVRVSAVAHPGLAQKMADEPEYAQAYNLLPLGRSEPGVRGYDAIRAVIKTAMTDVLENGKEVTVTLQAAAGEADVILAASGPDSAEIPPEGGTLVYTNTQGMSATVEFSPDALAVTETVSYVPLEEMPTEGLAFALVPNLTFSEPVTVTLAYSDDDIAGMDENDLRLYLYDWPTNSWVDANPCGGYARDTANNILQAAVCHFSDYAMIDYAFKVHLPVMTNAVRP